MSRFGPQRFLEWLITNFYWISTKNWRFTLNSAKTTPKRGIFYVFQVFANLRMKWQFLIDRTLKFVISDLKNPCGPNLDTSSSNTSKVLLFRGSLCKFKGVPPISPVNTQNSYSAARKTYTRPNLVVAGNFTPPPLPLYIDWNIEDKTISLKLFRFKFTHV